MKFSVRSDYAARAVFGLATRYPTGQAVNADALATDQGIPAGYLVQILIELKAKGIARSVRGKGGGYLLARPPQDISLGDVIRAVDGTAFETPALEDLDCPTELRQAWQRLQNSVNQAADSITFQDLIDEGQDKEKMYYI